MFKSPSTFERYTEQARRAIYFARLEAAHQDDEFIDPRHILVGLTWDDDSRVARLASLKSRAVEVRALLGIPHLPSTALPYCREVEIPLDNDAKKVLAYATFEADRDRQFWIDTDHLLRGLLRFTNDATDTLSREGLTLDTIRSASRRDRREHPPMAVSKGAVLNLRFKRYGKILLFLLFVLALVLLVKWMGPVL